MTTTKTTTKKTTMKAPKTPKTKVAKQVALDFESNGMETLKQQATKTTKTTENKGDVTMKESKVKATKTTKDNGKDTQVESQVKTLTDVMMEDELNDIENVQLNDDEDYNEEDYNEEDYMEEDYMEEDEDNIGDVSKILDKEEFTKLTLEEQRELMNRYVNVDKFTNEQLKIYMQLSTSQFYRLLEKLGLHKRGEQSFRGVARPKTQARTTTTKAKRDISVEFANGSVILEGDLDMEELMNRVEGFLNFGGGNEGDYEFRFELVRK